nr:helix-turn-helix domain-containing protein [Microbacterium sp. Bi98]
MLEEFSEGGALPVSASVLSDEDSRCQSPFLRSVISREVLESVLPGCGRGERRSTPPRGPRSVRHFAVTIAVACVGPALRCDRCVSVGRAAHVQSGGDPAEVDCFVWPTKLWHTRKPIPVSDTRNARDVTGRGQTSDADWGSFAQNLGVRLRQLRQEAGLSQEEVASRANLSRFIYRQYESGESRRGEPMNPALRSIIAISQVFEVSIDALLPHPFPDLRNR